MNTHALGVLEFREALERVAARASSELGREAIRALRPGREVDRITAELTRVEEALSLLTSGSEWSPPPIPDARIPLQRLKVQGGVVDPEGLRLILDLLVSSRLLREALTASALLTASRDGLPTLPALEKQVDRVVDEAGEIRDDASPELRSLRKALRAARGRIVGRLERFLDSLPDHLRVPDASVSIRDGRYVVPIRREGKSAVGGVVHGESGTGATLFVEPPLSLQLMAEIREKEREEAREIERILREVSERLAPHQSELAVAQSTLVDFDTLWARALTARRWEGTVPELAPPDDPGLTIVRGRHPLLIEKGEGEVVPFDLSMDEAERALVVSGPNTGGKTVFLKSLGLVHLLAQSGIIPPTGPGTRLPVLRDIFADIGDEQSIAESLSTFSAHLENAKEVLEGAGPGTLVLMDEMGTGTDPAEGAALARATLEILVERGARAVVTSHLGALKRLDRDGSGIVNASFLFDAERIAPTYHFRKGRPGRSYGLAIARRLGIAQEVLDRAESYVDSGELEVETLLATLEAKERALSSALAEAKEARDDADRLRQALRGRKGELDERERSAEARAREEARRILLAAREEVERAIREAREAGGEDRAEVEHSVRARIETAARKQLEEAPSPRKPRTHAGAPLEEGTRARVRGSGTKGVVREVRGDRVTLEVGGLRMELARADVEALDAPPTGKAEEKAPPVPRSPEPSGGGWSGPEIEFRLEADLRGLRVDEVELELGRAIDGAIVEHLPELRIIHGKGTGAVKARVRELLRVDRRVREFRSGGHGEGGAGVTVAVLQ